MMSMELAFCEKLLPLPVSLSHRGGRSSKTVPTDVHYPLGKGQFGGISFHGPLNEVCIKKFLRLFWETKKVRYTTNGRID